MKQPSLQPYEIKTTTEFDRSFKRLDADDRQEVRNVINTIANRLTLGRKYRDHPLKGDKTGLRDCHVKPDLVLIYKLEQDIMILTAMNVGSHSHVFHR